jgi:ribosomal protein S18 acetylase RimI-like enzyme
MIEIKKVVTKQDWNQFIDLPWEIYKNDPHWVPPLKIAVKDMLDVNKNPFFKHAVMAPFLAYKNGKCVGRVLGAIDDVGNKYHEELVVHFGFYECIDDSEVAHKLLEAVKLWGQSRGMKELRGPINLSTNFECGLLVQGFNDSPNIMMTYNPEYYIQQYESYGLNKAKDLYAYNISGDAQFSPRLLAQVERLKEAGKVTFRTVRMNEFQKEVDMILDIYNDAWEKNWGFVPMSKEEFQHMAKDMKAIVDPELLLIAEVRGEPVGFALALPDVNQAFKKIPDGKLLPFGLLKLLWNTKGPGRKKTIKRCRVLTLGIKQKYRDLGVGPILYTEYLKRGPAQGYFTGEASWILEDNIPMNRALENMCGQKSKVYRIYNRTI